MATDINISVKDKLVRLHMAAPAPDKVPEVIINLTAEEAKTVGKSLIANAEKLEKANNEAS